MSSETPSVVYELVRRWEARRGDGTGDRVDAELAGRLVGVKVREGRDAGRIGRRSPALDAGRRVEGVLAKEGSLREAMRDGLVSREAVMFEGTMTQLEEEPYLGLFPAREGVLSGLGLESGSGYPPGTLVDGGLGIAVLAEGEMSCQMLD